MLSAMLDHMDEAFTTPQWLPQLLRWWGLFDAFRRCLDFEELSGSRARTTFNKLMRMKPEMVIRMADQGGMGRRV